MFNKKIVPWGAIIKPIVTGIVVLIVGSLINYQYWKAQTYYQTEVILIGKETDIAIEATRDIKMLNVSLEDCTEQEINSSVSSCLREPGMRSVYAEALEALTRIEIFYPVNIAKKATGLKNKLEELPESKGNKALFLYRRKQIKKESSELLLEIFSYTRHRFQKYHKEREIINPY